MVATCQNLDLVKISYARFAEIITIRANPNKGGHEIITCCIYFDQFAFFYVRIELNVCAFFVCIGYIYIRV